MKRGVYPEVLEDIRQRLERKLTSHGIGGAAAAGLAFGFTEELRQHWGGQSVYIPIGQSYDVAERDRAIVARFDGRNTRELCREFRVSEKYLYRIIEQSRRAGRSQA